jgi:hypothetical protein
VAFILMLGGLIAIRDSINGGLNASWESRRVSVGNEHGHLSCPQGGRSCRRRPCR